MASNASSLAGSSSTSGKKKTSSSSQPKVVPSSQIVNFDEDGSITTQELVTPDNKAFGQGRCRHGGEIEKKILMDKADSIAGENDDTLMH